MSTRSKYDTEALCQDLAKGELTYAAIAERHGLSEVYIGLLARGESRPMVKARVDAIQEGMLRQARHLGNRLAATAMARLGNLISSTSEAPAEVQRKAAVDVLNYAIGDPSKPEVHVNQQQGPAKVIVGIDPDDV